MKTEPSKRKVSNRHTRNTLLAESGVTEAQAISWNGWSDSRPFMRYAKHTKKLIEGISIQSTVLTKQDQDSQCQQQPSKDQV